VAQRLRRKTLGAQPEWSAEALRQKVDAVAQTLGLHRGSVDARLSAVCGVAPTAIASSGRDAVLERIERIERSTRAPWGPSHQARRIQRACKLAGIVPPISFHGLRHTYASLAVQSGMALLALARNLGHTDTRMVEKHYGHLSNRYLQEQARRFAPAFGFRNDDELE
jgi:integrase